MTDETSDPMLPKPMGTLRELAGNAKLAWRLFLDARVPLINKLIPAAAVLYLLSPLDLVPDMALGLGQLDDLTVMLIAIKVFIEMAPPELRDALDDREEAVDTTYRVDEE